MFNKIILAMTLTLIMFVSGLAFGNKGKEIFVKQDNMDKGYRDQSSQMQMVLINSYGEKTVRMLTSKRLENDQGNDGDLSIIRFLRPADVRDTGLLTYERKRGSDYQWMYFPARKRVKRISSDNKSGSFMGSEFSYEDLGSRELEKYRYSYLKNEVVNGQKCFVVERYPTDRSSGYSKLICWVRTDNYQTIKIDYYDRKREHLKTLHLKSLKKFKGKHWRALLMEMENVQTGKKTILRLLNMRVKTGTLNKNNFTKQALGS